ncbi:MAG: F0F1 ATP synthase subunit A [Erysipelotrichaceae bacterium]
MDGINEVVFNVGDFSFSIHQSIINWFGVLVFVGIVLIWAGRKFKQADPSKPPTKTLVVFEEVYNLTSGVIGGNLNEKTWTYLPFMGTVMICMVISNLLGLLGLQTPTSNLSVNITLALMMFVLIHGTNLKKVGIKGKIKGWMEPLPFLFPLNVIGDIAFPVSLTLRLFGNMLGGTIIIALLYMFIKSLSYFGIVMFGVTPFLHMYFDIFAAFMQTYIFFMLASYFLNEAIGE